MEVDGDHQHALALARAKVRAWLCAIDLDSSMAVQQKELFKACGRMGWSGDVRALWHALDVTNSGVRRARFGSCAGCVSAVWGGTSGAFWTAFRVFL